MYWAPKVRQRVGKADLQASVRVLFLTLPLA
jgi:hypothetical protein